MPINVKLAKSIQKLDLKAGLSQLTKKENLIAHEQLEQIDKVQQSKQYIFILTY